MVARQARPEGEAAHIQQFGAVVEDARGDPGYLIATRLAWRERQSDMIEIGGPVQLPAFPLWRIRLNNFWGYGSVPIFNLLLLWSHIIAMRQASRKCSHETTLLA